LVETERKVLAQAKVAASRDASEDTSTGGDDAPDGSGDGSATTGATRWGAVDPILEGLVQGVRLSVHWMVSPLTGAEAEQQQQP
jgi:hypothetical protein